MSDTADTPRQDWRSTVFLPKTDFPMKAGLAQKEPAILARWTADDLYGRLRAARAGRERFILHDGPPYANGDIHMGHAMNKVLKDIIVRSQSLLGKDAPYIPGWDCHGLPIEWKVEEAYRKKKLDKDDVPKAQFRAECRAYAEKWVAVQRAQFERLGVMGEWDDPYLTMNYEAEATIAAELMKFAMSGQLYRGAKPVMWSPVERTALAEAEVEYEEIVSTQIDVGFEIVDSPIPELVGAYAVVWTTTPWTIPVNQAIAYGEEVEYVLIGGERGRYLVASDLVGALRSRAADFLHPGEGRGPDQPPELDPGLRRGTGGEAPGNGSELWRGKGSELAGTIARHPIYDVLRHSRESGNRASSSVGGEGRQLDPCFRGGEVGLSDAEWERALAFFAKPRPFLPGEHVTTEQGTGLVHMAPDHGEEDFDVCRRAGIDPVFAVADDGRYRTDWAWLGGQGSVINAKFNAPDGPICSDLREAGALLAASADFRHSYPHSWRSKAKIIYRCTPQWFIAMDRPIASPLVGEVGGGPAASAAEETLPAADAAGPHPNPSPQGGGANGPTLRGLALDAIARTRWVPEKARNRIRAMVEGRPDWVISRQRAWGVPIALYLHKASGDYLRDPAVNARIVAAFRRGGADAWFAADHQALLGEGYSAGDYEPVQDILDVWFDSGSTHVFTIERRYGEGVRADLYLEGSDQHRGWFQSSLLESCGTRGRAPYEGVLTHGFALDPQGKKMSKSLGNTVDPLKVMDESGADILRLWVASTDYFEDVRIGKDILSGTNDAYRKLRNTFRYLLGALDGFSDAEKVPVAQMPELERWVLHRLATLDAELRQAAHDYEFNRYTRAIMAFANDDLSAFFFDIRKDVLYCEVGPAARDGTAKRRAYRTVLDIVFHALVRWMSPVLAFTTEEVWGTRFPDAGSVHLLEWPEVDDAWLDGALARRWRLIRSVRSIVFADLETMRREKAIGSSLEAEVTLRLDSTTFELTEGVNWSEVLLTADVSPTDKGQIDEVGSRAAVALAEITGEPIVSAAASAARTAKKKCGRCWRHLSDVVEDEALCKRCEEMVNG